MSESKPMNVEFRTKCATTAMKAVHLLASPDCLDDLEKDGSVKGSPAEKMIAAGQTFQVDVKNDKSPVEISTEGKANVWLRKSQSDKRVLCMSDPDTASMLKSQKALTMFAFSRALLPKKLRLAFFRVTLFLAPIQLVTLKARKSASQRAKS